MSNPTQTRERGFTLVELAVVVVILGVLASFGVPRFMASVERSKASEAFAYLATVETAQERYIARQGTYASEIQKLDIDVETPEYFSVGNIKVPTGSKSFETGWMLTLTRSGPASGYGNYTVVYDESGYDASRSTIPDEISPRQTTSAPSSASGASSSSSSSSSSGSSSKGDDDDKKDKKEKKEKKDKDKKGGKDD